MDKLQINEGARVTLVGTGKLVVLGASSESMTLIENHLLVINGPEVVFRNVVYCYGLIDVKGGKFVAESSLYAMKPTAVFTLSGGRMEVSNFRLNQTAGATYVQTGGYAKFASFAPTADNHVSITGGVFEKLDHNITVTAGVPAYYGHATNVVRDIWFDANSTEQNPSTYYGDYLALSGDNGFRAYQGYVSIPWGIVLGCDADWKSSARGTFAIREKLHFDTADFLDPSTKRVITAQNMGMLARTDFAAFGGGTLDMPTERTTFDKVLSGFTLGADTKMILRPFVYQDVKYPCEGSIRAPTITLGANSDLSFMVGYNTFTAFDLFTVGAGAKIRITAPKDLTAGTVYALADVGPARNAAFSPILEGDGLDGWSVTNVANKLLLVDGSSTLTPDPSDATEWFGGSSGVLSADENWSSGSCPERFSSITFKTRRGEVVNDVDNLALTRIKMVNSRYPVRLSGKPVSLAAWTVHANDCAVFLDSTTMPLVFKNDVVAKDINNFGVTAGSGYVAFLGDLDASKVRFDIAGEVMIGGTALAKNFHMSGAYGSGGRATALYVLDGGSLTVTNLVDAFGTSGNSTLNVLKGGTMSITGGAFMNRVAVDHAIFGRLLIGVPLSTTATLGFFGKGRVDVASTKSTATAATVRIGEGMMFCPFAWNTVTADGEGPLTLKVETHATLGAKADWTYGVADGVTTETGAADRALAVNRYETLTVDTANPDTGAAQTITFADPIVAAGAKLVKTGAGTLVLASSGNDLATTDVKVDQGEFVCGTAQVFGSLTAAAGATLSFDAASGLLATATVNGDVSLEGVKISLTKAAKADVSAWTPVLTVPSGKAITGVPVAEEGLKVKVVSNDDGSASLCCKAKTGLLLIFR